MSDTVKRPKHYQSLGAKCPRCGTPIECIQIAEQFDFARGNAVKYLWRAGLKGNEVEDLKKARWYIDRVIRRLEQQRKLNASGRRREHHG